MFRIRVFHNYQHSYQPSLAACLPVTRYITNPSKKGEVPPLFESCTARLTGMNKIAPDDETPCPFPLLNPLMEQLAIRLNEQTTLAKSLVIPQAGEEANERFACFTLNDVKIQNQATENDIYHHPGKNNALEKKFFA